MTEIKKLQSLNDFNKEKQHMHNEAEERKRRPHYNGIACPECGAELVDSSPFITLLSSPPQKNVHCPNGDYQGYRIE